MKNKTPINFYEMVQGNALASVYEGEVSYFHRKVCRWYSEKFHTPLTQVIELPWEFVLSNYYESIYESLKKEDLEVLAKETFATDVVAKEEEENEAFAREFEERIKKSKISKTNKSESLEVEEPQPKEVFLNFDNLDE